MKKWLLIGGFAILALIAVLIGKGTQFHLSPVEIMGGPVRLADEQGDRLYLLTGQWEKRVTRMGGPRSSSSTRTVGWHNIDLWALDAATAQPIFRRRLKRAKVNADSVAMGVDQGVLWARIPELVGVRLSDAALVADSAKIEARNPALAGLMPKPPETAIFLTQDMQPLKFIDDVGLVVLLADARRVRIDPLTLEATPYVAPSKQSRASAEKNAGATAPSNATPRHVAVSRVSNGMDWYALVRGLPMARSTPGKGDWLGLLSESELETMKTSRNVNPSMDFSQPQRHRLYHAEMREAEDFFGKRWETVNPKPLPEAPEFLMAGLLIEGSGRDPKPAMWRRDPDSVFVMSRDRLGDDGHLQLARIAGPAGRVVWSTALPLHDMHVWLPGATHGIMLGPDPAAPRSPMAEEGENPVMQIVGVELASGALQSFNLDLHRDWAVDHFEEGTK